MSETIDKAIKIGSDFKKTYFTKCDQTILKNGGVADICYYRYGQLTVMIVPILYTAGEYAVAKISQIAKMSKISASLTENALMLNEKLAANGVSLLEAEGKTLFKNTATGETITTLESTALKDVEKVLDEINDFSGGGKLIPLYDDLPIKGTPNSGGFSYSSPNTPILELNNQGNVIKNVQFQNHTSSYIDGNLAHEIQEIVEVTAVKEGKVIQMYPTDRVSKIIPEVKNVPATELVPYNLTYFKGKEGAIELIIAESESVKGVAQIAYASALVAKKLKEEEERKQKCPICKERIDNASNSQLCLNLERLQTNTNNLTAISKLCAIVDLNNVLIKLLSYDVSFQKAFLEDINAKCDNNKSLCAHISGIDKDIVIAWKSIIDNAAIGTAFAKDWDVLQIVKDINNTPSKMAAFGPFEKGTIRNFDEFLNTYMACTPCNTCDTPAPGSWPSRFPKLDIVIRNSVKVYQTHKTTPDFVSSFYCGEVLAKNAINKKDGGQFMLRYMAENNITDNSQMIDRKFEYINPNAIEKQKEFDIFLGKNNADGVWFVECKSYEESTPIDVKQLKAYFSSIDKVANLNYVFNINKMNTESTAREAVQALLCDKTTGVLKDNGNELFEVIWNNNALSRSLFGSDIDVNNPQDKIDSKNEFKTYVLTLSNNFYQFIKVF